jgi:hypothetical protein
MTLATRRASLSRHDFPDGELGAAMELSRLGHHRAPVDGPDEGRGQVHRERRPAGRGRGNGADAGHGIGEGHEGAAVKNAGRLPHIVGDVQLTPGRPLAERDHPDACPLRHHLQCPPMG